MAEPKGKRRIFAISMMLIIISFGLLIASNIFAASPSLSMMLMTLSLILLVTAWWLYFLERRASIRIMREQAETAVSVVRCTACDYREERSFQKGDYVFKSTGTCPKCGGEEYIASIYGTPSKHPSLA